MKSTISSIFNRISLAHVGGILTLLVAALFVWQHFQYEAKIEELEYKSHQTQAIEVLSKRKTNLNVLTAGIFAGNVIKTSKILNANKGLLESTGIDFFIIEAKGFNDTTIWKSNSNRISDDIMNDAIASYNNYKYRDVHLIYNKNHEKYILINSSEIASKNGNVYRVYSGYDLSSLILEMNIDLKNETTNHDWGVANLDFNNLRNSLEVDLEKLGYSTKERLVYLGPPISLLMIWVIYALYLRKNIPTLISEYLKSNLVSKNLSKMNTLVAESKDEIIDIRNIVASAIATEREYRNKIEKILKSSGTAALILNKDGCIEDVMFSNNFMIDLRQNEDFRGMYFKDYLQSKGFEEVIGDENVYYKLTLSDCSFFAEYNEDVPGVMTIRKSVNTNTFEGYISKDYDELTSTYGRHHFTEKAEELIKVSNDNAYLALIDINNFKLINDAAGFEVGDTILMELASIITSCTDDKKCIIGRLSGDEFVILFTDSTVESVEKVLLNIHSKMTTYQQPYYKTKINISVSIGVVEIGGLGEPSISSALQYADFAAMTAKKNNTPFQFYDSEQDDIIFFKEAPLWINRIKSAIELSNFEIFVQEIKPSNSNITSIKYAEVLIRMKDGNGGYYSPFHFFGVAEKFNLMKSIDEWVINKVFEWLSTEGEEFNVSVNISADSIKCNQFIADVIESAKSFNVDPERVIFEVTETMVIDDIDSAVISINELKKSGFKIALDDFGSGFSTLKYLQSIDADILKIDGIFIKNIKDNKRDKSIVENVVSIAHELNMKCVAEFVEDYETTEILSQMGVDYVQGFGIHIPESANNWLDKVKQ